MDRERLVNLLRDAKRKAAQYLANDFEGMYDDISEALEIADAAPVEVSRPVDLETIRPGTYGDGVLSLHDRDCRPRRAEEAPNNSDGMERGIESFTPSPPPATPPSSPRSPTASPPVLPPALQPSESSGC